MTRRESKENHSKDSAPATRRLKIWAEPIADEREFLLDFVQELLGEGIRHGLGRKGRSSDIQLTSHSP